MACGLGKRGERSGDHRICNFHQDPRMNPDNAVHYQKPHEGAISAGTGRGVREESRVWGPDQSRN